MKVKSLSRVQLFATPQTVAYQVPPSMGFSRQEHWSGLPFSSPMHVCMLSRFSHVQLCVALWTVAHQAPLSVGFSRQEYWSGLPFPSPGIFSTQGSNLGLLHCRQILYHLSHQGSPSYIYA